MSSRSKSHHIPANGRGGHGWRQAFRAGYGYGASKARHGWACSDHAQARAQRMGYRVDAYTEGFIYGYSDAADAVDAADGVIHR